MPKTKISEYSATANSNTDVASINIDEGCAPSGINNAIRAVMGHLKDFQSGTSNDPFTVGSSGSLTLSYGTANGVAYLNGSKVLTTGSALTFDGATLGSTALSASGSTVSYNLLTLKDTGTTYSASNWFAAFNNSTNATVGALYHPEIQSLGISATSALVFGLGSTPSEQMRLTSTGLGIGTSSPGQPLHVSKNQNASTWAYVSNTTAGTGSAAGFLFASDVVTGAIQAVSSLNTGLGNNNSLWIRTTGAYPITLGTNSTVQMTLDSSGNLGIGTSSPGYKLEVLGNVNRFAGNSVDGIFLSTVAATDTSYYGANYYNNNGTEGVNASGRASWRIATVTAGSPTFSIGYRAASAGAGVFSTPLTIDSSGNLLVGGTTATGTPTVGFCLLKDFSAGSASGLAIGHQSGTGGGAVYEQYSYNGSAIGSITQNGTTGVLYNLTSDYRLKNDQQALTGAKDFIMALKPKKWQWWDGSGEGVGFVAHEFMEVAKHSGNGEKDAVDADGKPVYQSIQPSSSEVMANLVAFIQEQQAIIQSLTARITALEGA